MTVSANYTVKSGDTLAKIAAKNGMTVAELAAKNGIKDVNKIIIGQELVINDGEGTKVEAEPTMSDAEFEAKMKSQQDEINKLKNRTLSQQAKQEIKEFVKEKKEMVKAFGEEVANDMKETLDACEKELEEAYAKGEEYYEKAKAKANAAITKGISAAKKAGKAAVGAVVAGHNAVVDAEEDAARYVADKGKKVARAAKNAVKFDVPAEQPKEKTPDFSKMTKEEIIAYNQEQIDALKNESLTDRAKKEIKAKINAAERYLKTAHNTVVDTVYDKAKSAYHTVADGAKKLFGWMKW